MKRNFDNLSKEDLPKLKHWLRLSQDRKGITCPLSYLSFSCNVCKQAFPRSKHKIGLALKCPCHIYSTVYITKVARQAVAYLEGIK